MSKGYLVIGLGTFGAETARVLYRQGGKVLAVDAQSDRINAFKDDVTLAVCADAKDEQALEVVGAFDLQTAVVALRRHFDTSVLVTYMLKKRGFKEIIVQVDSLAEAEAIKAVGATGVVFPERDMAERIVRRLMVPNLTDLIPLGDDVAIVELPCPKVFAGKTLIELAVRKRYGIDVIALKLPETQDHAGKIRAVPASDIPLEVEQNLILLGTYDLLRRFREKHPD